MMNKHIFTKAAAYLLSLCVIAGMMPVRAETAPGDNIVPGDSTAHTFNLNRDGVISGIGDPEIDGVDWSGSKLYFGSLDGNPLRWRVLDSGVGEIADKKVMLLHTDTIVETMYFDTGNNNWKSSRVRDWLKGTASQSYYGEEFLNEFTEKEIAGIYIHTKPDMDLKVFDGVEYINPGLDGSQERVFLLNTVEAIDSQYGYGVASARKLVSSGDSGAWWLRSPVNNSVEHVGVIDGQGKVTKAEIGNAAAGVFSALGVAPAFYLDTASILFTTPANKAKPDRISPIEKVGNSTQWKLTLLDQGAGNGLNASLDGGGAATAGDALILNHTAASSSLTGATQVSALLTDLQGTPLYYGRLGTAGEERSEFTVPAGLASGNYKIYVFAEKQNGGNKTDLAGGLGNPVSIVVKADPEIKTYPGASPIVYGQTLADSVLTGGEAKAGGVPVSGSFAWKDQTAAPTVADSGKAYDVIFTPDDTSLYNAVTLQVKVNVEKVQNPPVMPAASVNVEFGTAKVNQVPLPAGWSWRAEDAQKDLTAGGSTQAVARYQDILNYVNCEAAVTINRAACAHRGGTASCAKQAVCEVCGQPYGSVDANRHGVTEVRGAKAAVCTEKGYTGDTYCRDCNAVLAKGQELAALGHDYKGVVTKEPTESEEGVKTYTCSRCGNQYTEKIEKHGHSHYYNNVRTLKWVSCVQQGEIEHSCGCGDSYVEVLPAWGHDYKVEVTKKATTQSAGMKIYTCKRCGYAYAEEIPKLSGNISGSQKDDSIADRMPVVKGNSSISGWNDINKAILKAPDGDTINIGMNDSLILPKKTLETLKERNVTLILDMGKEIQWSIKGNDITSEALADLNLKVTMNGNAIPGDLVKALAGDLKTVQMSLAHEGEFGLTAFLQVKLGAGKAGDYANLFYYNVDEKSLDYIDSQQINEDKECVFPLSHASEYLIVLDNKVMDGTVPAEPEPSGPAEPSLPVDNPSPVEPEKGDISAIVVIIIGLVILGIGLLTVIILRARSRQEDFEELEETLPPPRRNPSLKEGKKP